MAYLTGWMNSCFLFQIFSNKQVTGAVEGAKMNCCDYDSIVHYPSGGFNAQYKTNLHGKVTEIARIPYNSRVTDSFRDSAYKTYRTTEPIVLYRVFGQYLGEGSSAPKGAGLNGSFASTEFAESIIDAKLRLALDPAWANTKMYEARLIVPANIMISVGIVASVRLKTGTVLPGGADQILLPKGWPEDWITGYRRLTSRQLQAPPYFNSQKPSEYDRKENLYRMICPSCGCEEYRKLEAEEQFTIIGQKGNRYIMQYVCLNPDCQYHW